MYVHTFAYVYIYISMHICMCMCGVSFLLSSCRDLCKAIRVASEIRPLVLIQTSVVIEWVANLSLPSRHHPLCRLHLPSALAILWDSLRGGWDLFLAPSGWVRRIQLSVVERVGISSVFSSSIRPGQFMTIGCGLTVSSPQILSAPLLAFLKKGGIVKAVSPWYCVAWKTLFSVRSSFRRRIYVVYPCLVSSVV